MRNLQIYFNFTAIGNSRNIPSIFVDTQVQKILETMQLSLVIILIHLLYLCKHIVLDLILKFKATQII